MSKFIHCIWAVAGGLGLGARYQPASWEGRGGGEGGCKLGSSGHSPNKLGH